jgi:hypothetical protein
VRIGSHGEPVIILGHAWVNTSLEAWKIGRQEAMRWGPYRPVLSDGPSWNQSRAYWLGYKQGMQDRKVGSPA